MGKIEEQVKKRIKRYLLHKVIIGTVAAAGILSVGLLAPNVVGALAKMGIINTKRRKEVINQARERLITKGLLERNEKGFLKLTPKGETKLRELERREYQLPPPKKWDKKWRLLIFDIPEKRKVLREKIRNTLRTIGFSQLQKSVWIYPYDCEDLIALLKADFKIGKDLLYLVVEEMENDKKVRAMFGLPQD
jgi:CRISPR-associated endonuclease Cas2